MASSVQALKDQLREHVEFFKKIHGRPDNVFAQALAYIETLEDQIDSLECAASEAYEEGYSRGSEPW